MRTLLASLVSVSLAPAASAVIVHGDPLERPDNAFVGLFRGGSAVAIGEHHLLTAAHVGGRANFRVFLGGERYRVSDVTAHPEYDLALIEVSDPLPGWHNVTSDLSRGDHLVFGGYGVTEDRSGRYGYTWSNERGETWGENLLDRERNGYASFDFDRRGRTRLAGEATFTPGDSGTGVFVQNEATGALEVAGVAVAVTGRYGFSLFGSRGIFVTLGESLDYFDLDLTPFVPEPYVGPLAFGVTPAPAPGSALLAFCAVSVMSRRRRG